MSFRRAAIVAIIAAVAIGFAVSGSVFAGHINRQDHHGTKREDPSSGISALCLAAGTWAAATHDGEHLRRPDPLEGRNLLVARARAATAVRALRQQKGPYLGLAKRLVGAIARYQRALASGVGLPAATRSAVSVLGRLPPSCVLASRTVGPA